MPPSRERARQVAFLRRYFDKSLDEPSWRAASPSAWSARCAQAFGGETHYLFEGIADSARRSKR
ncbi:MAG: hypothetical protein AB1486_33715 [Planctomycetota bacterium]